MAQDNLGLFDATPSRTETRIGLAIVGLISIILLAALPVHSIHVGAIPGLDRRRVGRENPDNRL